MKKKKINPTSVGIFLVGAMVLIALGIVFFGSGDMFSMKKKAVLYFRGSVSGLKVGAPVKFQGVTVGQVKSLHIWMDTANKTPTVPVVIELNQKLISTYTEQTTQTLQKIEDAVQQGLRGKLETESMVTGVLYVGLEMAPHKKGYAPKIALFPDTPVIPSTDTTMDTIMSAVGDVVSAFGRMDLEGISSEAKSLLVTLREKTEKIDTAQISDNLVALSESGRKLLEDENLKESLGKLNTTLTDVQEFARKLNESGGASLEELQGSLQQITHAIKGVEDAVGEARSMIAPNSRLRMQAMESLDELGNAAKAVRELAEYLERNPNALITGKKEPK